MTPRAPGDDLALWLIALALWWNAGLTWWGFALAIAAGTALNLIDRATRRRKLAEVDRAIEKALGK